MAQLMIVLDASIVNIALPAAQKDLGISDADRQWVITAYPLAFGGLLLLGGRIADFVGRKRAFLWGLGGFAVAPAALSLITVTFTVPKERARAFGVFGAISGGGSAIG